MGRRRLRCALLTALLGLVSLVRHVRALANQPSICVSAADCCSFSSSSVPSKRALPCCGSDLVGPDAIRCGDDGRCHRGDAPCKSSMDDPLCNIPTTRGDADGAMVQWRSCRRDSVKMRSLMQLELYGGGASLLIESVAHQRSDAVDMLLHEGAAHNGVNARGYADATALHVASTGESAESTAMIQQLVANGADVNAVDAFGFTPLHRAIQANNIESVALLLSNGANLTLGAPGRESPLHLAAYENDRALAQLLLAFGADPFARNGRGATSFEVGLFDLSVPPHHMN